MTEALASAPPHKQPQYAPIFIANALTGMFSQRHVFHDPANVVTARFYGGRPDTIWDGTNIELSNELTLIRRFGTTAFSAATSPDAPNRAFSFELSSGAIQVLIDTPSIVYRDNQDGTKTTIFTKSNGAGQGFFVAVGNTIYYGDGIDTFKYTFGNPNGVSWNWGIAAPITAPTLTVTAAGASAVNWVANTVFSTMGLLVDGNSNVQQLFSVNALGNNSTQLGSTGTGTPNFSTAALTTTVDGTITWTSQGQITLWAPATVYQSGAPIYDPGTNCIFIMSQSGPRTSTNTRPNFTSTVALGQSGPFVAESGNDIKWQNIGSVGVSGAVNTYWAPSTAFNQYQMPSSGTRPSNVKSAIAFPLKPFMGTNGLCNGQATYLLGATTAGTSSASAVTPWTGIGAQAVGAVTQDNQLLWVCLGPATPAINTARTGWVYGNATFSVVYDGTNMQVCIQSGTTEAMVPGTSAVLTAAGNASGGNTIYTGTFSPVFPSSAGYSANITGFTNSVNNGLFKIVSCTSTQLTVANPAGVAETHAGTAVFNPWGTTYGSQTHDGSVVWTSVGPPVTWAANTQWYLPSVGFAPPLPSQAYGGASVVGGTPSTVQFVTTSGKSQTPGPPSWNTTIGNTTTDGGVTWTAVAAFSQQSITWTKSHTYAYSFKSRIPTDPYVTTGLLTYQGLNTSSALMPLGNVPGLTTPIGPYLGSGSGGISTASPIATISTPNTTGAVVTVAGTGSTDPQVDTIVIWRDADGGGAANMFELVEIPAPQPIGGVAQPWQFKDFLPDVPSTVAGINYPGLDALSPAPIAGVNNPPPAGFIPFCEKLHFQRIFGAVGNTAYMSGGPDTLNGASTESFNAADNFPFNSTITGMIHTPAGLIVPTTTDFECIYGGPSTASFYDSTILPGVGMLSENGWTIQGGEIYFFSSDSQFWTLNPALQLARLGFPIGNKLAGFNSSTAYVTVHDYSTDNAIYVADGSTGWFRLNPHQVGADIGGENVSVWSPKASITGGCKMVQSVVTGVGVRRLLIGATTGGQVVQKRDTTVFSDNGSSYSSWFDIGAITLVSPGQRAVVKFVEMDFASVGTQPTVSFVTDDPTASPSWNAFSQFVFDPPMLYGGTNITPNYWPDRFYLSSTAQVVECRRIRLKVDYGSSDTVRNELISFSLFGRKYQEN